MSLRKVLVWYEFFCFQEKLFEKTPNKPTLEILEFCEAIKLLAHLFIYLYIVFLSSPSSFLKYLISLIEKLLFCIIKNLVVTNRLTMMHSLISYLDFDLARCWLHHSQNLLNQFIGGIRWHQVCTNNQ